MRTAIALRLMGTFASTIKNCTCKGTCIVLVARCCRPCIMGGHNCFIIKTLYEEMKQLLP